MCQRLPRGLAEWIELASSARFKPRQRQWSVLSLRVFRSLLQTVSNRLLVFCYLYLLLISLSTPFPHGRGYTLKLRRSMYVQQRVVVDEWTLRAVRKSTDVWEILNVHLVRIINLSGRQVNRAIYLGRSNNGATAQCTPGVLSVQCPPTPPIC